MPSTPIHLPAHAAWLAELATGDELTAGEELATGAELVGSTASVWALVSVEGDPQPPSRTIGREQIMIDLADSMAVFFHCAFAAKTAAADCGLTYRSAKIGLAPNWLGTLIVSDDYLSPDAPTGQQ